MQALRRNGNNMDASPKFCSCKRGGLELLMLQTLERMACDGNFQPLDGATCLRNGLTQAAPDAEAASPRLTTRWRSPPAQGACEGAVGPVPGDLVAGEALVSFCAQATPGRASISGQRRPSACSLDVVTQAVLRNTHMHTCSCTCKCVHTHT